MCCRRPGACGSPGPGSPQEEKSRSQCQALQAKYDQESSESKARHEEAVQALQKLLLQAEERLQAAQAENGNLLQEMTDLKKQADKAKVAARDSRVLAPGQGPPGCPTAEWAGHSCWACPGTLVVASLPGLLCGAVVDAAVGSTFLWPWPSCATLAGEDKGPDRASRTQWMREAQGSRFYFIFTFMVKC